MSAEETGGMLAIESAPGKGTRVRAVFHRTHTDMRPIGDLEGTLKALIAGSPGIRFICDYSAEGQSFRFDTSKV